MVSYQLLMTSDPTTSKFFGMPKAAIKTLAVDSVVLFNQITATLLNLIMVPEELQES